MSCDLSDPHIPEAYEQIMAGKPTNWMILGYRDSRDTISLYSSGSGGTEELQKHLSDEVLYVYVRILNHRFVLASYVPETVSGVRRARALVHGRTVGTLLKDFEIHVSASKPEDLTEAHLKLRLKPRDNSQSAGQGAPGAPPRTKKTKGPKDGAADAAAGRGGFLPSDGEPPPSASEESPQTSPGPRASPTAGDPGRAPADPASPVVPARTRVAGGAPSAEASVGAPAEPAPAPAPGIAAEAAADDDGGRGEAPDSADDTADEAAAAAAQEEAQKAAAAAEAAKQKAAAAEAAKQKAAAAEAAKKKEEADKRAAEAARARREAAKGDQAGNQKGWICIQLETTFWKRRWFEIRGKTLHLFKDPNDQDPVCAIELGPQVENLDDAHHETLMPHSFKIVHKSKGLVYFYSDDVQAKVHAMNGIRKAAA